MKNSANSTQNNRIIHPPVKRISESEKESDAVWGFEDTAFTLTPNKEVILTGNRYELSGEVLPELVPWIESVMNINVDPSEKRGESFPPQIPAPIKNENFLSELRAQFDEQQIDFNDLRRLRQSHGHTQEEMYQIKQGQIGRIPDVLIFPETEQQVQDLVNLASKHNVCLIPYGGGTNVTQALQCPEFENRMIVSVGMQRLNHIEWIDPVNRMAKIQAGAVGRHIIEQLSEYGFTMGHEPDSVEFSTLGGWIATNASGMKKNRYGNIEDIVLDFTMITAEGKVNRSGVAPRESTGTDARRAVFGSEGNFGIVTSAVVKIFPKPEVQNYGSLVFPTVEDGVAFIYEVSQSSFVPASLRLVDNLQFQFSHALKPKAKGLKALVSKAQKFFITKIKKFDPNQMVACTLVCEGTKEEVARQEKQIIKTAKKFGGLFAGSENGKRGYQLTFSIAYIRDFVMKHHVIAESFETAVPWSQALTLVNNVKRRILEEHQHRNLPGLPFISCRFTQVYHSGVCIYFYLAFCDKGVKNPHHVFAEIEEAARDEILKSGGSLSHHHGIGKIRQKFLSQIKSPATLEWEKRAKTAWDPQNIFGAANQGLAQSPTSKQQKTGS